MGRNRALGSPYQTETVKADFTTNHAVDAYMIDAVPLVVTLDPNAANNDQVLIQDVTDNAASEPIVINASDGQTILNGYGSSISISTDGGSVQLTMTPDGWVPQLGGASGGGGGSGDSTNFYVLNTTFPVPHEQSFGIAAVTCFAAIVVNAKKTGVFDVDLDLFWSSTTTGEPISWALVAIPAAAGALLSGGTAAGFAGSGATDGQGMVLTSDAVRAAGILFDGSAVSESATGAVVESSGSQAAVTGQSNGAGSLYYGAHGIMTASPSALTPFDVGDDVCFGLILNGATASGSAVFEQLNFTVKERLSF